METGSIEIPGLEIYPNIYKGIELGPRNNRQLVGILIGAGGSGKDRIVCEMANLNLFRHILTATSRLRRFKAIKDEDKGRLKEIADSALTQSQYFAILKEFEEKGLATVEPENAYVWMRWMTPADGTEEQYYENLRQEYELIENDVHNLNLYGLPKRSLALSDNPWCIPVIRTEINGAVTLNQLIPQDEFQIVNFTVLPDSLDQTQNEMIERATNLSEEELQNRIQKNIEDSQRYKDITNFYIRNTRAEINGRPGIETTVNSLAQLTEDLLRSE